ncbi:MAG: amino acid ABC transporter permease [Pseudomonadota bacterium]
MLTSYVTWFNTLDRVDVVFTTLLFAGLIATIWSWKGRPGALAAAGYVVVAAALSFLIAPQIAVIAGLIGVAASLFLPNIHPEHGTITWYNDPRKRGVISQGVLFFFVVYAVYGIVTNTIINLERQNIASGFGFLSQTAGYGINFNPFVDYSEASSYGKTFWVGLQNTLIVAGLGILLATILGFLVGVARLSNNLIISKLAYWYIEINRNIPLLLHIFIWYFAVLRAVPDKRDKWSLFDTVHLNILGVWIPEPLPQEGFWITLVALAAGIAAALGLSSVMRARQMKTGQTFPTFWVGLAMIIAAPMIAFFASGSPLEFDYPKFTADGPIFRRGFDITTGFLFTSEFVALLLALSIYTAAYIAEIVRAGIMAVSHGQTEAANALGLRNGPTLRLVVIPQALRVIIPPLTNQYLNLTKNSSLAVAIAYPDLVATFGGTTLNQTGQAVEIITVTMLVYLTLSLVTSAIMNWYNARIALVER